MKRNNVLAALVVGAMAYFGNAVAEEKVDLEQEAAKHLQAAIAEGKQGKKEALLEHAKAARQSGRARMQEHSNPEIEKMSILTRQAIDQAEAGKVDDATKTLEEALKGLTAERKSYQDSPM